MEIWASTFFIRSKTTDTTISKAVPPMAKDGVFVNALIARGRTAMMPRNKAPSKVLTRITLVGALFLGIIAGFPLAMRALTNPPSLAIGGTALLIVVSVVLDLMKKVDAQISMREY